MAVAAATSNMAPLSVVFEDLMRHYDQCLNYDTSSEFLEFAINQEECRRKWNNTEEECKRLQSELETSRLEISRMERKIQEIRKHLEGKLELINKAELEKDRMAVRSNSAIALLKAYLKEGRLANEFKERLANVLGVLETGDYRAGLSMSKSPANGLDTISEAGSTDLSMTQSEDDLDVSVARSRRHRSKRPSMTQQTIPVKRTRQSAKQMLEMSTTEQLIAKTIVSFPKDGPVQAVASLETFPSAAVSVPSPTYIKPSAPPMPTSESESDTGGWLATGKGKSSPAVLSENQRATNQMPASSTQSPRFGRTLSSGGPMAIRPHAFCQKTVIKPEMCEPCGKRIKFSKMALKCRDCKATCHPECKDEVPIPCVKTGTPSNKHQNMGTIADYVPAHHPMVPALIQHCVNEIEKRGLDTVGLYRVPGAEREVKDLREKFLRGKGIPNLARYDIYAICACVKDFLRSLQEPLVGRWFWRDFTLAVDISDPIKRQAEIERIVHDLPPPNQDTLAFMLLHLQGVAENPAIKMPIGNLAKVFGPTIVGYSKNELDAATMLLETKKQQMVLHILLAIPGEFWKKFAYRSDEEGTVYTSGGTYTRAKAKTMQSPYTPHGSSMFSNVDRVRNSGKKIYFSDDSPKEMMKTRSTKRTFFE